MPTAQTPSDNWEIISDFRKGIHEFLSASYEPGTAQITNTYRCYGRDSGALAPLPGLQNKFYMDFITDGDLVTPAIPETSEFNYLQEFRIVGIKASPPAFFPSDQTVGDDQNNTEVFVCLEWVDHGVHGGGPSYRLVNRINRLMRMKQNVRDWEFIWDWDTILPDFDVDHPLRPTPCDFAYQRTNHADPTQVGGIAIAWSVGNQAHYYPSEITPGTVGDLPGNNNAFFAPAHLVTHQGRVILFPLFFSLNGGNGHDLFVNTESFYWSSVNDISVLDPALYTVPPGGGDPLYLNNIVAYEYPTGYGVMESLSADHLLLIKAHGGGVMLQGSMNDYRADTLSNIRPTGLSQNRGTRSSLGFVYPVENGGVHLWNGSDLSFPLTPQMSPNFWRPPQLTPAFGNNKIHADWGYGMTTCDTADRYIILPNNYVIDTDSKALWRLENPDDVTFHQVSTDYRGELFYCAPSGIRNPTDPCLWEYSVNNFATSFSWQSHPLYKSIDYGMEIKGVGIVGIGEGSVKITCKSFDYPDGISAEFQIRSNQYPEFQQATMHVSGTHVTFQIESFGLQDAQGNYIGAAPVVNELRYNWRESTRVAPT